MKCEVLMLLVLLQVDASYQQNILPEHKRRHCKALQEMDIMEHALPVIRRFLQEESENSRCQREEMASALRGVILLRCEPGWIYHDNHCYLFSQSLKTWEEAIVICQNMNAYLADIRSDEENRFVKMELSRLHTVKVWRFYYFLGGHLSDKERKWTWRGTGECIGYTDWAPGEPNNDNGVENCLTLQGSTDFKWNDYICSNSSFICKKSVEHELYP